MGQPPPIPRAPAMLPWKDVPKDKQSIVALRLMVKRLLTRVEQVDEVSDIDPSDDPLVMDARTTLTKTAP